MKPDNNCYELIKNFEGLRLTAYQDVAGIWTIGYGSILYKNGMPVKSGDTITESDAFVLLQWEVDLKSDAVKASLWLFLCPIFGLMFAAILLAEPITLFTIIGTILVLLALLLGQRESLTKGKA